ncbi:related to Rotein of unknown function [Cephalotrichum gorgonifer]|uniref:YMC020W-like alpha/beta hydrolase domain-containing protein n=1 Tax=Cephalotrichum gorgonifer TaxID=2041049 RepID=A0AAE8MYL7_9PEZI|nr:related to Rotein of unknown function [Cephalotrichum gorgonifer]
MDVDPDVKVDVALSRPDEPTTTVEAPPPDSGTSEVAAEAPPVTEQTCPQRPPTSSSWLAWLGATAAPASVAPKSSAPAGEAQDAHSAGHNTGITEEGTSKDEDVSRPSDQPSTPNEPSASESTHESPETDQAQSKSAKATAPTQQTVSGGSWFGLWPSGVKVPVYPVAETAEAPETSQPAEPPSVSKPDTDVDMTDAPAAQSKPEPVKPPSAGSTWAFWSRDTRTSDTGTSKEPVVPGELAVFGEGSESHPLPANSLDVSDQDLKSGKQTKQQQPATPVSAGAKNSKRARPQSMEIDIPTPSTPKSDQKQGKPTKGSKQDTVSAPDATAVETPTKAKPPAKDTAVTASPPNLLLPSFKSTYRMKDNPSIMRQITDFLLRTKQPPANHVYRVKEPPKIKKALAIGIHGLFPASYLKPIIGQPTGTSLRFANLSAEAIRRWADSNGHEDCEIEKIALEGEGKIFDRVNNLWTLLLNWIEDIRHADLIIIACHSQGVPVSVILLAKLIDFGIIKNAKIGVCAMAGVTLGPFPDYKSSMGMFMGAAAELWELANPASEVSQRYEAALKEVLDYGARITFIGSIDDQLVPMESAVCSPATHPYIYRAVFIDGRIHAPDFIAHLVGFALKLRNLGVSDHGLIRELSIPLAGSLYGGEGHSRIYFDDRVYDLAVSHALETTDVPAKTAPTFEKHGGVSSPNPYHLPWVMRGLLEEDFVKTELLSETDELLRQFDAWKPTTKALKDVKYRLEAVRSKL